MFSMLKQTNSSRKFGRDRLHVLFPVDTKSPLIVDDGDDNNKY